MTQTNNSISDKKINYLKYQMILEAIALIVAWILIVLFLYDITDIKQLIVLQGILGTATVIWWMIWERSRRT